jgi:hypothetical protein
MARKPTPTIPAGEQRCSKLASEGAKGFGSLASSLDVCDAVAVESDRSGQDDKEHNHIREKGADADINVPKLKFFECCSSTFGKGTLACHLLLLNFFTSLPEKQIRTDRGAENCDQHRPFISGVRH